MKTLETHLVDCLVTNNVKDFLPSYPDLKIYNPSEYLEMLGQ